jgi:pimeloyl-ACP methyl ester carboxylesterase
MRLSLQNPTSALVLVLSLLRLPAHAKELHHVPYGNDKFGNFDWNTVSPSRHLTYHTCYDGLRCARLEVPLDWSNTTNQNSVVLAIGVLPAKVKRTDPRYGGTVLIQPGGPGGSGLDLLRQDGRGMQDIIDSDKYFDVLAWDPRGVKFTTPSTACFEDDLDRQVYSLKKAAVGTLDLSDDSFDKLWAAAEGFAQLCAQSKIGIYEDGSNIRQYVSTALVARDMVAVIDAVDDELQHYLLSSSNTQQTLIATNPPLLQYWGYSYGTYLGNIFASMFPHRIGRMLLDGVVDAPDYAATGWTTNLQDTHKALSQMLADCFDGKGFCPLYSPSMTSARDLGVKMTAFLIHLRDNPIPVIHDGTIDLITLTDVQAQIFDYLYSPMSHYSWTGEMLADLLEGNTTLLLAELPRLRINLNPKPASPPTNASLSPVPPPIKPPESSYAHSSEASSAILCGDGTPLNTSKAAYRAYLSLLQSQEPLAAGYWASIALPCIFWPSSLRPSSSNTFTGPFTSNLSSYAPGGSPILWIGNTADPVTPLRNAFNMARSHEGSVVLTQDMPGHCSGAEKPSLCTWGVIARFFAAGVLPETGTVCAGERRPWDGKGGLGGRKEVAGIMRCP